MQTYNTLIGSCIAPRFFLTQLLKVKPQAVANFTEKDKLYEEHSVGDTTQPRLLD